MSTFISLDDYTNMINSFRTNDLQALLSNFTRNKGSKKSELRDRALELLKTRTSPAFNQQAYLLKIVEISRSMQSDMPSNISLIRLQRQNQRQQEIMTLGNIEVPPQRMYQPPPQYSQQPMQMITRAGLPQVMPQMQRGIYGNSVGSIPIQGISMANSNIQYLSGNNYQMAAPRAVISQLPMGQRNNVNITSRPTVASTADSNAYMPSAQILSQLKFKKLPFYNVTTEIMKPTLLIGSVDRLTLQNAPRDMKETVFKFNLSIDQATHVANTRDTMSGKIDYYCEYQIRICQLEPGCTEVTDYMPLGLVIRVNTKSISLPPVAPNPRAGTESRRSPRPIDCTEHMKLSPIAPNVITINWIPEKINYAMGIYLVNKLTTDDLIQKIKEKGSKSLEETRDFIIQKLSDNDPDFATSTSYRFSVICPLGRMRMEIPVKSIHCDHLQCFDATTFIKMNEKKPTWMCPTCNKPCLFDDIQIQDYFLEVVTSPDLKASTKEVDIFADGTWKVYEYKNSDLDTKEEPAIDTVDLDSDDETSTELKKDAKPNNSQVKQSVCALIDLTIGDEKNSMVSEAILLENEALAADNIQVITIQMEQQAQVQPQQAVTSSEQGEVIEIDSPSPPSSPNSITDDS